jgi:hypothetical protein
VHLPVCGTCSGALGSARRELAGGDGGELLESSPSIDQDIIALFNKLFNKDYPHVSKPIVCNGLREVCPNLKY